MTPQKNSVYIKNSGDYFHSGSKALVSSEMLNKYTLYYRFVLGFVPIFFILYSRVFIAYKLLHL